MENKELYEQGERLGRFFLRNTMLQAIYDGQTREKYLAKINDFMDKLPHQKLDAPFDKRVLINYYFLAEESIVRHNMFTHWVTALEKAYLHLLLKAGRWTLGAEGVKNLPPIMQEAIETDGKENGIKTIYNEAIEAYQNALAEAEYIRIMAVVFLEDDTIEERCGELFTVAKQLKDLLENLTLFAGLDASLLAWKLPAENVKKAIKAYRKIRLTDNHNTGVQSSFTTRLLIKGE